jgi:putative transposase
MQAGELKPTKKPTWRCQYHIVFSPKYRRMAIYGQQKKDIGWFLQKLCDEKGVEIIQVEACPDHIHLLVNVPPKYSIFKLHGIFKREEHPDDF